MISFICINQDIFYIYNDKNIQLFSQNFGNGILKAG